MQSGLRRLIVAISESIQSLRLRMHESNTYCKLEKACYQNLRLGMQFHRIKSIVKPCFPGEALPYSAYTGMCRWKRYGFQGLES